MPQHLETSFSGAPGQAADFLSNFRAFLTPLTQQSFKQVSSQLERELSIVNQSLQMLKNQGFERILHVMLESIAFKIAELLNADRTSIFLVDDVNQELWSIVAEQDTGKPIEIRLPLGQGVAGFVASQQQTINAPFDFYSDPRSHEAQQLEQQTGYRTYTLLAVPLFDQQGKFLAVVQLLNKLLPQSHCDSFEDRLDPQGFTAEDEKLLKDFSNTIRLILESSQRFHAAARQQQAAAGLMKATQSLNQSGLKLEETLQRVMDEAKQLMNADRSTFWLLDRQQGGLRAEITTAEGASKTLQLAVGQGYVGQAAARKQAFNIPYDLYQRQDSDTARQVDQISGYRTYSLLCVPAFNPSGELIGVTQLVNKRRNQPHLEENPASTCQTPIQFRASFSAEDEAFLEVFNIHAGVALQNALFVEELEKTVVARTQELHEKNQQLQREVEERRRAEATLENLNQELQQLADLDGLTQVANRRYLDEYLQEHWLRSQETNQPLSLILCDIDCFKQYNDTYGHLEGDKCLQQIAQGLSQTLAGSPGLVARFGGEEFTVILPNTAAKTALAMAEHIRQKIWQLAIPHTGSKVCQQVTLSLGIATCLPSQSQIPKDLIAAADKALYQAKAAGRNRSTAL
ncbi:MAG: sensor domain-containing diguanylate cyclase [Leptolyngbyaceae cyanobacterium SM1_1_3]|nr:sensor domain-containing diguanylate cyclase [Leptolyngbyaceae cyanobacterium SM1_1_3]NJN03444.1 sensor domain-containing diguanylate cyclase [Leptolyngbyaceae cyanobacterium RM1_1_2]NJO08794.1 sensor domain-containing diguanylate cyclase [Leptolyngbyaceae cyanobacterium SL_1_1]